MAIYDLSIPLKAEHPPWPGDALFSRQIAGSIAVGDSCNISCLEMGSHFGTHIDAPYHFEENGIKIDEIPLETLMGRALVHEVDAYPLIQPEHLPDLEGVERILFKTSNCWFIDEAEFHTEFVSLGLEAARVLVQAGVKLVGIDYFSIEAFKAPGHPVHHELCGGGVILLEGVDLRPASPGWYELLALPLKIEGCDGSPCRSVLRDLKE